MADNYELETINIEGKTIRLTDKQLTDRFNAEVTNRENVDTALQNNINTLQGNINSEAATRASADSNLQSQINQIIAPSGEAPSAAEVQNARIGADGVTYQTLGDAIRTNDSNLKNQIDKDSSIISTNLMGIDVQENLYPGAVDWSGAWINSNPSQVGVSDVMFDGYPTVYSSQSWRRYYKEIPVVAGNTYTFEAWIKTATAGTVAIYITDPAISVSDPATVTQSVVSYQNTPANEWRKLSITFTCTASGNITPFVTSRAGAFYIAKYVLVEGESAFSLSDAINNRPTRNEISVGDYKRYDFSGMNTGGNYWNPIIEKNIPTRTKVKFVFDSYSGSKLGYVRVDGRKADGTYTQNLCSINAPKWGDSAEFTTAEKYTALRIQFGRSEKEDNVSASVYLETNSEIGLSRDLMDVAKQQHVYYVEKDGSGDFTTLVEAIKEATKCMDSVVYIGAGTWNIIDEFGETYMNAVSSNNSTWGLVLKNRVHLIGTAKTVIKAVNNSESTNFENIKTYFSVFNAGEKGFTLENINIEDENIRYSVHDDRGGSGSEPYTNRYIRCSMIHKNGKYPDCIGAGLGENQTVEIRGCYFEGDLGQPRLVYWHGNNNLQVTDALGKITVCDNYFAQDGTFMLTKYGQSNTDTVAYVSNNSFGTAPSVNSGSVAPYDNMRIVAWNNEIRS